ncbi:hypothetical protein H1R20_g9378, partial [Candolleomyces eurysporus]
MKLTSALISLIACAIGTHGVTIPLEARQDPGFPGGTPPGGGFPGFPGGDPGGGFPGFPGGTPPGGGFPGFPGGWIM